MMVQMMTLVLLLPICIWVIAILPQVQSKGCPIRLFNAENNQTRMDINLETSVHRKESMQQMFSFYQLRNTRRIAAISKQRMYVPPTLTLNGTCTSLSATEKPSAITQLQSGHNHTMMVSSLCGGTIDYAVLGCTISHLYAIYRSLRTMKSHPYALILEDDAYPIFELNYSALISSAPKDFAVLQLMTSHLWPMNSSWALYRKYPDRYRWVPHRLYNDTWAASAYIIQKSQIAKALHKVFRRISRGLFDIQIDQFQAICARDRRCCHADTMFSSDCYALFQLYVAADYVIYHLVRNQTYLSSIPLFTGSHEAQFSTLHLEHVLDYHAPAYRLIYFIIQEALLQGRLVPPEINLNCSMVL